jgi:hypothetical protein
MSVDKFNLLVLKNLSAKVLDIGLAVLAPELLKSQFVISKQGDYIPAIVPQVIKDFFDLPNDRFALELLNFYHKVKLSENTKIEGAGINEIFESINEANFFINPRVMLLHIVSSGHQFSLQGECMMDAIILCCLSDDIELLKGGLRSEYKTELSLVLMQVYSQMKNATDDKLKKLRDGLLELIGINEFSDLFTDYESRLQNLDQKIRLNKFSEFFTHIATYDLVADILEHFIQKGADLTKIPPHIEVSDLHDKQLPDNNFGYITFLNTYTLALKGVPHDLFISGIYQDDLRTIEAEFGSPLWTCLSNYLPREHDGLINLPLSGLDAKSIFKFIQPILLDLETKLDDNSFEQLLTTLNALVDVVKSRKIPSFGFTLPDKKNHDHEGDSKVHIGNIKPNISKAWKYRLQKMICLVCRNPEYSTLINQLIDLNTNELQTESDLNSTLENILG